MVLVRLEQILKITEAFRKKGDNAVLITRMSQEAADLVGASLLSDMMH